MTKDKLDPVCCGDDAAQRFVRKWTFCFSFVLLVGPILASIVWLPGGFGNKVFPSILAEVSTSPAMIFNIVRFAAALIILHISVALVWAWLWKPIGLMLAGSQRRKEAIAAVLMVLSVICLVGTSATWHPHSRFSPILLSMAESTVGFIALRTSQVVLLGFVLVGTGVRVFRVWKRIGNVPFAALGIGAFAISIYLTSTPDVPKSLRQNPDVIVIGIDSLRMDHLATHSLSNSVLPSLTKILSDAAVFSDTLTPLARTFPAYLSVLTGNDPITHGGRFNLISPKKLKVSETVADILRGEGYQTAYAIDESRFSNLDQEFGFDYVIAPPMGAADFLLGEINDLPLTNLVSNTWISALFFPQTFGNRAAYATYDPETFHRSIVKVLDRELDDTAPLFLVVHFELPHWPYVWRDAPIDDDFGLSKSNDLAAYRIALRRVDQQVEMLMESLRDAGRLDNALVVFLSDHGEAFEIDIAGIVNDAAAIRISAGHGTHVLSNEQYQVLFAFLGFGPQEIAPGERQGTFVLTDFTPTLLDWLDIGVSGSDLAQDGRSLAALLLDADAKAPSRFIYLESGLSVPSVETGSPTSEAALLEGARFYEIRQNGRLELREEWLPALMAEKQRAVVLDKRIVAAIPFGDAGWELFDMNRENGSIQRITAAEATEDRVLMSLVVALCRRYAIDTDFAPPICAVIDG